MKFKLSVHTDNAAFEDRPRELAEVLRGVAKRVEAGADYGLIFDSNGNSVGSFNHEEC